MFFSFPFHSKRLPWFLSVLCDCVGDMYLKSIYDNLRLYRLRTQKNTKPTSNYRKTILAKKQTAHAHRLRHARCTYEKNRLARASVHISALASYVYLCIYVYVSWETDIQSNERYYVPLSSDFIWFLTVLKKNLI